MNTVEIIGTAQVLVTEISEQVIEVQTPGTPLIVEVATPGPQGPSGLNSPILQSAWLIDDDETLMANRHGLSLESVEVTAGTTVTVPVGAIWTILAP